ncbi:hypothetical protein BC749_10328 [Flavobacterium araucananum]|jgi:hypothetical protein|uniref:Uncharacterized protein n=1 Tax=Flavobacterium araucananum TaxID=946678 RepID=A0A227PHY4_9FLAO|nr:hypothetical protein [Flavobacterium araucananum]OXG09153.1 hypothetical protein B0A64_03925 [Flavobacterium araucananum]PWJ99650.1 hypothetical protein BC749_10328 [Flavobacterium araucananum]
MENSIREVYGVVNGYVYIFDIKTRIQNKSDLEPIIINDIAISENLSMKFRYILGSLNFMFSETLSTNYNAEKRQSLAVKIIKLLLKIVEAFEDNTDINSIEERIYQIDSDWGELRSKKAHYQLKN